MKAAAYVSRMPTVFVLSHAVVVCFAFFGNMKSLAAEQGEEAISINETEHNLAIRAFEDWTQLDIDGQMERYKRHELAMTQSLIAAIVKNPKHSFNPITVEHFASNGRIDVRYSRERRFDQFELINLARKYIDNGSNIYVGLLSNYSAIDNNGNSVLLERGDTAPIIALKLGYEFLAYDLLAYTQNTNHEPHSAPSVIVEYAKDHNAIRFLHLLEESDSGLIDRMLNRKE